MTKIKPGETGWWRACHVDEASQLFQSE